MLTENLLGLIFLEFSLTLRRTDLYDVYLRENYKTSKILSIKIVLFLEMLTGKPSYV